MSMDHDEVGGGKRVGVAVRAPAIRGGEAGLEREMSGAPGRWPRSFVVDLDGSMIGQILLTRATEHRRPAAAGKADLGYLFLPRAWGFGYATEACAAALGWLAGALPGEPVVLTTQTANVGSMRLARSWG